MAARQPLVLIVEDEEPLREVLSRILETQGYRIETAFDGQDGLEKVRARFEEAREAAVRRKEQRDNGQEPEAVEPEGYGDPVTADSPSSDAAPAARSASSVPYLDKKARTPMAPTKNGR